MSIHARIQQGSLLSLVRYNLFSWDMPMAEGVTIVKYADETKKKTEA